MDIRRMVYLRPEHEDGLRELAAATGIGDAELIKMAIDKFIREPDLLVEPIDLDVIERQVGPDPIDVAQAFIGRALVALNAVKNGPRLYTKEKRHMQSAIKWLQGAVPKRAPGINRRRVLRASQPTVAAHEVRADQGDKTET